MYNWNDVRVEQEIAQERYQQIVKARRVGRVRQRQTAAAEISTSGRLLGWLGDRMVRWGCALQKRRGPDFQSAVCHSGAAG